MTGINLGQLRSFIPVGSSGSTRTAILHEAEIADAAGRPLTVLQIRNDSAGFARLLARVAEVAPGPRIVACIEGGRSYGIGLARALSALGLLVIECEQPSRKQRRGKGKSDSLRWGTPAPG
jgi:transposase